ncbi:MAG: Lhr family helicase, partial [Myxococcaceae bacterium]
VRVVDAQGQAPSVPFWRGEAPSRTDELSAKVSFLREKLLGRPDASRFLETELRMAPTLADFLLRYLRASEQALGALPTTTTVIAERFFDEAGGMQLIIHAPFGGRINRAWGLALRKRFCRTFDFELQAAATDDGVLLSLGEQHSFPLEEIFGFLSPSNVEEVLVQAILQTPLFGTRFRWNATRALAMTRFSMGKRVPPQIQRARSDDLLASVFPAQVGCQDNHGGGDLQLPDHPLINQTVDDCLREAMDVDGLKEVLRGIKSGSIRCLAVERAEPSPLSHALLNSQPYTYLDDAPLEERRARAVSIRRSLPAADAAAFGALDEAAIAQVVADAQPILRSAEELHDALLQWVIAPAMMIDTTFLSELVQARRAIFIGEHQLVAAERVAYAQVLFPMLPCALERLPGDREVAREAAALAVVRGAVEVVGPTTVPELARRTLLPEEEVLQALHRLEQEGQALRGRFRPSADGTVTEWCDRRLLQRIHALTVGRLRKEIEPLSAQDFMRFLFRWHHVEGEDALRGKNGMLRAVSLLQGYEAPAAAWEQVLFPSRMGYLPELLEKACWSGEVAWGRLTFKPRPNVGPKRGAEVTHSAPASQNGVQRAAPFGLNGVSGRNASVEVPRSAPPGRNASITFLRRDDLDWLLSAARPNALLADGPRLPDDLSTAARDVAEVLDRRGACFFRDLVAGSKRLAAEVEDALWELLARGIVSADSVDNLRVLQSPKLRRRQKATTRGGPGRWSLVVPAESFTEEQLHERTARLFLQRYGIVWRDLVVREALSPTWRELLFIYRRLEARGEIRGGRFVSGFAGEQFALPEAVDTARSVRRAPKKGTRTNISAVDPLNLTGVVTPGPRVPAILGHVVTYVDGIPESVPVAQDADIGTSR